MDVVFIKAAPFEAKISPLGFHLTAVDFLFAARSFKKKAEFSMVPYFLYCRSIELALKGFLLAKDLPKIDMKKKLRHDLEKVLNKAKEMNLDEFVTLQPKQEQEVRKANAYYSSKDFEYFQVMKAIKKYPDLPSLSILEEIASLLINKLQSICENA